MNEVDQSRVVTPETVSALTQAMVNLPDELKIPNDDLTRHHFCKGVYCREFFLPAGATVVGKKHKHESFFMLVRGTAHFSTADGTVHRIEAPFMAVTQPGSQRVVHAETDSTFLTFHPNPDDEQSIEVLEDRYIIPTALPAPEKELLE